MRNLEFKAALTDTKAAVVRARSLGAELWGDLRQTDTYFRVANGRLKLRETAGFQSELVYYERDEAGEERPSDFSLTPVPNAAALLDALSKALGVIAVVRKRRTLLLLDTTRIHLDNVDGLGNFLELEVPASEGGPAPSERLAFLMQGLGYTWDDCIRRSYVDLIREREA
jgi:predicted adenylyl cyclase CyaB